MACPFPVREYKYMLQALRNKLHGWPSILVLGICVFAVAFFGIESYFMTDTATYVAKVGKHEITQQQYQDRLNQMRQDAATQQNGQSDPAIFDQPATKLRVVNALVDQELLSQHEAALHMVVPDSAVSAYIASLPAFQVDGHFDRNTYFALLGAQHMQPATFEDQVRTSLALQQLPTAISGGTLIPEDEVQRFLDLRLQRRDIRYIVLPHQAPADTKVSDSQAEAWYKAHSADYMQPEQVSLNYVEVNTTGSADGDAAVPTDAELHSLYDQEKNRFVQAEQREVSHILISVPHNATPAQQKAALEKAQQLAAQLTPANFAELARKNSDDVGSRVLGGDLGWLQKGVANAAFDAAAFSMSKGQISKPVLSPDEGYHIIWLRDIRSGDAKPFAEVRPQLVESWQKERVDREYNDLAGKLTDATNANPSSLAPAAQALHLPVQKTALFSRSGGTGIAADPKVIAAAFSDDVLHQGNNSNLIELGHDHAVIVHVDQHVPEAARPLAEVRAAVDKAVLNQRAEAAAQTAAAGLLARLQKGEDIQAVASSVGGSVQTVKNVMRESPENPAGLPPAVVSKAFLLPHPSAGKPVFASVDLGDGSAAVLALDQVQGADPSKVSEAQKKALGTQMAQAYGNLEVMEYVDDLRRHTKVQIFEDRL
ncbi:SurA N-terminal domain-containing protein [Frateuria aurantia]